MMVSVSIFTLKAFPLPFTSIHLDHGWEDLGNGFGLMQAKFPAWPKEHQLKGGISPNNARDKNVRTY
ncbi:hypothetical protein J4Q44_G00312850 [Coregonus suidteri]|uniref:Uncharacterized protein n=1 Tax=Coregonus suidteri TaxID=861788 RepID=A0AAN8KZK5_9TELE